MSKSVLYGFPKNLRNNVQQTMTAALAMVESFLGDTGIELPTETPPENLVIPSQKLKELIPPDDLARIEEHNNYQTDTHDPLSSCNPIETSPQPHCTDHRNVN
jgi:hypothetical protein